MAVLARSTLTPSPIPNTHAAFLSVFSTALALAVFSVTSSGNHLLAPAITLAYTVHCLHNSVKSITAADRAVAWMLCIAMLAMQAGIFAKRLLQPVEDFAFIPGKIAASPAHIAAAAGQWLVYGVVLAVQPLECTKTIGAGNLTLHALTTLSSSLRAGDQTFLTLLLPSTGIPFSIGLLAVSAYNAAASGRSPRPSPRPPRRVHAPVPVRAPVRAPPPPAAACCAPAAAPAAPAPGAPALAELEKKQAAAEARRADRRKRGGASCFIGPGGAVTPCLMFCGDAPTKLVSEDVATPPPPPSACLALSQCSPSEKCALQRAFDDNPFPDASTRAALAAALGKTETQVRVFFQNARQRARQQRAAAAASAPPAPPELAAPTALPPAVMRRVRQIKSLEGAERLGAIDEDQLAPSAPRSPRRRPRPRPCTVLEGAARQAAIDEAERRRDTALAPLQQLLDAPAGADELSTELQEELRTLLGRPEAMAAAAASSSAGEALAVATDSIISKASMDSAMDWFMNPNPRPDNRKRKAEEKVA